MIFSQFRWKKCKKNAYFENMHNFDPHLWQCVGCLLVLLVPKIALPQKEEAVHLYLFELTDSSE